MKKIVVILFMFAFTGCYKPLDESPELSPGECFVEEEYSEFAKLVIKTLPRKNTYSRSYLIITYDRFDDPFYFYFRKAVFFNPVKKIKCSDIDRISIYSVKKMKYFNVYKDFLKIIEKKEKK